jgi:hypothetical protein
MVTQTVMVAWEVSQLFGTSALVEVQGFCRILPDFLVCEQLSRPLNLLLPKAFRFSQQALLKAVSEAMPIGLSLYLFLLTDAPHPQL